jgi:hypothetical protein
MQSYGGYHKIQCILFLNLVSRLAAEETICFRIFSTELERMCVIASSSITFSLRFKDNVLRELEGG